MNSQFAYTTYIRSSRQQVWEALTDPGFNEKFWFGYRQHSAWKPGATWTLRSPGGAVNATGEIQECVPLSQVAWRWFSECTPDRKAEGETRCAFTLEPVGDCIGLTVTHSSERQDSAMVRAAAGSWPKILASFKSLIETGRALDIHRPQKETSQ